MLDLEAKYPSLRVGPQPRLSKRSILRKTLRGNPFWFRRRRQSEFAAARWRPAKIPQALRNGQSPLWARCFQGNECNRKNARKDSLGQPPRRFLRRQKRRLQTPPNPATRSERDRRGKRPARAAHSPPDWQVRRVRHRLLRAVRQR